MDTPANPWGQDLSDAVIWAHFVLDGKHDPCAPDVTTAQHKAVHHASAMAIIALDGLMGEIRHIVRRPTKHWEWNSIENLLKSIAILSGAGRAAFAPDNNTCTHCTHCHEHLDEHLGGDDNQWCP